MERSGTYRQQAISTANLLREAADQEGVYFSGGGGTFPV